MSNKCTAAYLGQGDSAHIFAPYAEDAAGNRAGWREVALNQRKRDKQGIRPFVVRLAVLEGGSFPGMDGNELCISGDFPHSVVREEDSLCVSCDSGSSDSAGVRPTSIFGPLVGLACSGGA